MANVTKPNTFSPSTTIDSSDMNDNFDTIYNEFNGNISAANLATGAVTTTKIADDAVTGDKIAAATVDETNLTSAAAQGWYALGDTPDTVTYNGNRSYDLVFNSNDLTDTVSNGMRLKLTRTVTAPTQCTDLESGSSQYWSKTSPTGISFTTTFTLGAWVKLESYTAGGIIARRNADTEGWNLSVNSDGTVTILGLRIASNNKRVTSYQSIPLNKWVHVAATLDMTAGDTSAQKIWFDGVEVPRAYTLTGTATAIVQGTTALVVGAEKSAGTNPFDGKIAQAFVNSTNLSTATIQSIISQGLSGSETGMVSAYSFNGVATDLNANANNLTAQNSAVATATDTPFAGGATGTTEYGIITANTFSTDTTLTVQVPEGYAIPTSGGVSAVSYSTQDVPYGFPRDKGKWEIITNMIAQQSAAGVSTGNFTYSSNQGELLVPVGCWNISYAPGVQLTSTGTAGDSGYTTLSSSSSTVGIGSEEDKNMTVRQVTQVVNLGIFITGVFDKNINITSATTYYRLVARAAASLSGITWDNDNTASYIKAVPTYV